MKYFVTNVSNTQYTSKTVTIKPLVEVEVEKPTYDYLNEVFGTSGKFTFRTDGRGKAKKTEAKGVEVKKTEAKTEEAKKPKAKSKK
jgi:hypothetical protein